MVGIAGRLLAGLEYFLSMILVVRVYIQAATVSNRYASEIGAPAPGTTADLKRRFYQLFPSS